MTERGSHGYCLKCEDKIKAAKNMDIILICSKCADIKSNDIVRVREPVTGDRQMCKELDRGRKIAKELCEHLIRMGAEQIKFPIEDANRRYTVGVKCDKTVQDDPTTLAQWKTACDRAWEIVKTRDKEINRLKERIRRLETTN